MVEWQATVRPDAVAIREGERTVTYRELAELAGRVAGALRTLGARPGTLIGTCLPRGTDLVIAQLGILKSGAAYLPLDPSDPRARLACVVAEADPVLVVSATPRKDTFPTAATVAELLAMPWTAPEHTDDLPGAADPDQFWANLVSGINSVRAAPSQRCQSRSG